MTVQQYESALDYLNRSRVVFYCNKEILSDYVILDCNILVQAVRKLLDLVPPNQLAGAYQRLQREGIASYNLIKQAWSDLPTDTPLNVLVKYLEHYGILYDVTAFPLAKEDEREYAVIARLPSRFPAEEWGPKDDFESKSIYVRFDQANGVHQSLFYVLLAYARRESQRVAGFIPVWSRMGGVFAFKLGDENFWKRSKCL